MSILNNTQGKKCKKRVGRGIGSGKGRHRVRCKRTRSGVAEDLRWTDVYKIAKRGFNPINKIKIATINLDQLQNFLDKKRLDPLGIINLENLQKNKIINKSFSKFKLLANGTLKSKIDIEVDYSSISAKTKIEKLGGVVKIKNPK